MINCDLYVQNRHSENPANWLDKKQYTLGDFKRDFPDEDACLSWLKEAKWPDGIFCEKCRKVVKHHRVRNRKAYACDRCGNHVHPMAGTILQKSSVALTTWFHAMFLMADTRCRISAKDLQRETGVNYKTAWRMFRLIRSMLNDDISLDTRRRQAVRPSEAEEQLKSICRAVPVFNVKGRVDVAELSALVEKRQMIQHNRG